MALSEARKKAINDAPNSIASFCAVVDGLVEDQTIDAKTGGLIKLALTNRAADYEPAVMANHRKIEGDLVIDHKPGDTYKVNEANLKTAAATPGKAGGVPNPQVQPTVTPSPAVGSTEAQVKAAAAKK